MFNNFFEMVLFTLVVCGGSFGIVVIFVHIILLIEGIYDLFRLTDLKENEVN